MVVLDDDLMWDVSELFTINFTVGATHAEDYLAF